jgi:pyruvate, water dikinase
MGKVRELVRRIFPGRWVGEKADSESLRLLFRSRYHHFKLLLNANQKALGLMAEIEEALRGKAPFGMSFVRSRCTAVSTNVFQIVRCLNELAPGRYEPLLDRFKEIRKRVDPPLPAQDRSSGEAPLVLPLEEVDRGMADLVGSKLCNLGEIGRRLRFKIPRGFAVTASAYVSFMKENDLQSEIDRRIQSTDPESLEDLFTLSASIQQMIISAPVPEGIARAIGSHLERLIQAQGGRRITFAMRSSALGEDVHGTSFAGQYRSELNVSSENILEAYKGILASKYTLAAMAYRLNRGLRDEDVAMCVGCLEMVDAVSGGVAYSRNPLDIRDETIEIHSAWGLPKSVVEGSSGSDVFVVDRSDPSRVRRREVAKKEQKFVCYPEEGLCRVELTREECSAPSLTDGQAVQIAALAGEIEGFYRTAQDVEWALDRDGSIFLLQCRPLQQREEPPDRPAGEKKAGQSQGKTILQGGVTASPGVAVGPVYAVHKDMDGLRFPAGAVLLAAHPFPRWAALLGRAAAVITTQGGIAGHLASVAREFRVPALFGVQDAMERLRPGDLVTVDADGRKVYEGRIEALLAGKEEPRNLMEGSPVYEALRKAADQVIPLNLLDPESPGFRPENCRTFHDITRFCHEKSVKEMFRFGRDHHFPERSSKQLLCQVPMQWWILNLDDGFREEVEGRYVRLENIVSVPMLAVWEGITAMPWEGPPPVDGKGFASVMFEATRNTALVPGMKSNYGHRNYFVISRNYCSLSSRLGFHFSIIEALVSDRGPENYLTFQFKGGAADLERRSRRVHFIREILEEQGFRVEVKEDTLIARVAEEESEFMKQRLRILGFLTIHTRQLDMIMSNPESLQYYGAKLRKDIREKILQPVFSPTH